MSLQRLTALRALMASQPASLSAYIIPTADAHNSEYIAPTDARREWLTGFTGSAGTAVVTPDKALVWTDGRYYTQFEKEADLNLWTLMKSSLPEVPTMEKWLTKNLVEGAVVGVDPFTMTREEWSPLERALTKSEMKLVALEYNLVDKVRKDLNDEPPARPNNPIVPLSLQFTGKSAGEKIAELREKLKERKASALVLTALDEIAYVLNLRGSDIEYNPVFFSYLVITPIGIKLFWFDGQLSPTVLEHFARENVEGLTCYKYEEVVGALTNMAKTEFSSGCHSVWLSNVASEAIHRAASGTDVLTKPINLISEVSPVALMKLVKNDIELEGFRKCHIRDGTALIRFFNWLEKSLEKGTEVNEVMATSKLLEFRQDEEHFVGPSFETIAGAGENGAVIHYSPSKTEPRSLKTNDMFLLDSGGQYKDGTTDITRTRHLGTPTEEQIDAFTRVLKGQMKLGSAVFPQGVKGNVLDSFARQYLWEVGLDYAHGTGHGVGHFLNVHEGPSGVSWRPYPDDPGLKPGQILSNEPGFYKVGEFGIRHEDLVEIVAVNNSSEHPRAKTLKGDYDGRGVLGFNTITLVPHQTKCIDIDMLDDFELNYLNAYHKKVLDTIGPVLKGRNLIEALDWLNKECQPLDRNQASSQILSSQPVPEPTILDTDQDPSKSKPVAPEPIPKLPQENRNPTTGRKPSKGGPEKSGATLAQPN